VFNDPNLVYKSNEVNALITEKDKNKNDYLKYEEKNKNDDKNKTENKYDSNTLQIEKDKNWKDYIKNDDREIERKIFSESIKKTDSHNRNDVMRKLSVESTHRIRNEKLNDTHNKIDNKHIENDYINKEKSIIEKVEESNTHKEETPVYKDSTQNTVKKRARIQSNPLPPSKKKKQETDVIYTPSNYVKKSSLTNDKKENFDDIKKPSAQETFSEKSTKEQISKGECFNEPENDGTNNFYAILDLSELGATEQEYLVLNANTQVDMILYYYKTIYNVPLGLFYKGKQLKPSKTFNYYGINNRDILTVRKSLESNKQT
jgi:hypothetical protein